MSSANSYDEQIGGAAEKGKEAMTQTKPMSPDAQAKIQVLLAEYGTLRQEIVSRTGTRFGLLGLFLALATFITIPHDGNEYLQYSVGGTALIILLTVWGRLGWLMNRCGIRIVEIEKHVNMLIGEELLVWENRRARTLLFHKFFPLSSKAGPSLILPGVTSDIKTKNQ